MEVIHHYTSIETLALILKYKTFRFSRLDTVDDIHEETSLSEQKISYSKYAFVSCWTESPEENIPLWHMYTEKMRGVRLTFPKQLFDVSSIKEMNEGYFILPTFRDEKFFYLNMEYVKKPEEIYSDLKEKLAEEESRINISIPPTTLEKIAKYKTKNWEFQNESRFKLFIFPASDSIPQNTVEEGEWAKYLANNIVNQKAPEISYYDVPLREESLNELKVTLGPLCTDSDKIIVESLLNEYCGPDVVIKESSLTGKIRAKK